MESLYEAINYIFIYISLFVEVFLLISFFERKNPSLKEAPFTPPVTILVPCFNEEDTIKGTLASLLALDYPKSNYSILVINDGSTDGTERALEEYKNHPQIKIYKKENGGKHTALNFGLALTTTEYVGCLDADSFVEKNALLNIMKRFEDQKIMAVTPSTIVFKPKTFIQKMQKAEYHYGNFMRQALSRIGAIHITPGPFSFFRKTVFAEIGLYKKAHNTEDMEIAMRMQKHGMKLINAYDAVVYTASPSTLRKLYKQRVRWVSGFFGNLLDYKFMILNKRYGDLGMIIIPSALFGIFMTIPFVAINLYKGVETAFKNIERIRIEGLAFTFPDFSLFFVNTSPLNILSLSFLILIIIILAYSRKMTDGKWKFSFDFVYLSLYMFLAPVWLLKAIYNNALAKETTWR